MRLRLRDGRLRSVPRSHARLPLVGRLEEDLGVNHTSTDLLCQPLDLRIPALDLGLVFGQDRLRFFELRFGGFDVGVGHLHHLLGQLDPLLIERDARLLRAKVLDQFRHEELGEHVALLHLIANVHDPLVDIGRELRVDRRAFETLDEAWLTDDPDDLPGLRLDNPDGRGLRDARVVGLLFVPATGRREGSQQAERQEAAAGGTIGNQRPGNEAHWDHPCEGAARHRCRP